MRDWIGFNKDASSDMLAKTGQWNLAVAARDIAEALAEYVQQLAQNAKELPPVSPDVIYDVVLSGGKEFTGAIQQRGSTWIEMHDLNGKIIIVRTSQIACLLEHAETV